MTGRSCASFAVFDSIDSIAILKRRDELDTTPSSPVALTTTASPLKEWL
jgi:hypothetical protein